LAEGKADERSQAREYGKTDQPMWNEHIGALPASSHRQHGSA
jgi:hypothetical protein